MTMIVLMPMPMIVTGKVAIARGRSGMSIPQEPSACEIHRQPEHRDRNRLVERNRHRVEKARDTFPADQQRDHRQRDGARESREISQSPGAETEALVPRVPSSIGVG